MPVIVAFNLQPRGKALKKVDMRTVVYVSPKMLAERYPRSGCRPPSLSGWCGEPTEQVSQVSRGRGKRQWPPEGWAGPPRAWCC